MDRQGFKINLEVTGQIQWQIFPSVHPLVSYYPDTVAVLGRVYYQAALKTRFPDAFLDQELSPATLVFHLYQAYGWEALTYLEGEFALAIYDRQKCGLILARDPLGSYPLYWQQLGETLEISTNLSQLASPSLNLDFLGSFLMTPFAFVELDTQATVYQESQRVLAGHLLYLQPNSVVKKLWAWNWQTKIIPTESITLAEASGNFLELLRQAIAERQNFGKTASHLSGGMDSSTITCLGIDLLPLSLVYKLESLAQETAYIEMICQAYPHLQAHYIDADRCLDFQWFLDKIPEHDEPYQGLGSFPMDRALLQLAAQLEINTVLTGMGAEIISQGNYYYLADLLHQGKLRQLLQQTKAWARAKNLNPWALLYPFALAPLLPKAWIQVRNPETYRVPPWISNDFAQAYQLEEKGLENRPHLQQGETLERSQNLRGIQSSVGSWVNWYLANPLNIHLSHPFLDPRLIVFSLGLPLTLRSDPALTKPLLQEATKGILPEPIRTRRYKANFNEVYQRGLSQALPHLKRMILESPWQKLGIFEPETLIEAVERQALGVGTVVSGSRLNNSLALIAWFSSNPARKI
jgi:asparagine synthase (glutamine-hydrolysing)